MKIGFYAHASFRLETPEVSVVTDPYTPEVSGFKPIDERADLVIMSSATDQFRSDPSHVRGQPTVVNALLDVPPDGTTVRGVPIRAFPTSESLTFDFGRDPDANAMYLVTVGGVRILHMGDVGNAIAPATLEALSGQVDVLLALTGAHATIALEASTGRSRSSRPASSFLCTTGTLAACSRSSRWTDFCSATPRG